MEPFKITLLDAPVSVSKYPPVIVVSFQFKTADWATFVKLLPLIVSSPQSHSRIVFKPPENVPLLMVILALDHRPASLSIIVPFSIMLENFPSWRNSNTLIDGHLSVVPNIIELISAACLCVLAILLLSWYRYSIQDNRSFGVVVDCR